MEKGSACVEAFHELSHRVSQLFGDKDRSRRHKEVKFARDIEALVMHMLTRNVHSLTEDRIVPIMEKAKKVTRVPKNPKQEPKVFGERDIKSAVVDVMIVGVASLQGGKFQEFLRTTTIDPNLGYPVGASEDGAALDEPDPSEENAQEGGGTLEDGEGHDEEPSCPGVGGLGGHEYE